MSDSFIDLARAQGKTASWIEEALHFFDVQWRRACRTEPILLANQQASNRARVAWLHAGYPSDLSPIVREEIIRPVDPEQPTLFD